MNAIPCESIDKEHLSEVDDDGSSEVQSELGPANGVAKSSLFGAGPTPAEASKATKKRDKWGPVQATRHSSRIVQDGVKIVDKAVELAKQKNLEVPVKGTMVSVGENAEKMESAVPVKTLGCSEIMCPAVGAEGKCSPSAARMKKRRMAAEPRTPELLCRRTCVRD
ncbi:hypothetical protein ACQ4PT_026813 [Festuca glaucescens]